VVGGAFAPFVPPVADAKAPKEEVFDGAVPTVTVTGPGIDGEAIHLIEPPPPPPFPAFLPSPPVPPFPPAPITVTLIRLTVAGFVHVPEEVKTVVSPLFSA
jgi:hypothetical protein